MRSEICIAGKDFGFDRKFTSNSSNKQIDIAEPRATASKFNFGKHREHVFIIDSRLEQSLADTSFVGVFFDDV